MSETRPYAFKYEKTCRYCGDIHEIQTAKFQGGMIETCPMVPRDRFVAFQTAAEKIVPKPDHALVEIDGDFYYRAADGREVQITDRAWVGPPKSTAQINYEMREKGERNKARGILKHGPYGSGEAGPCDVDCAKCAHEKPSEIKRDSEPLPVVFDRDCPRDYEDEAFGVRWVGVRKKATHEIVRIVGDKHGRPTKVEVCPIDREAESAAWSAQLRVKLAEQKDRDAEAACYTPWWSPEEQQGGDL